MQSDVEFAVDFAETSGDEIVQFRATTARGKKIDRTDVTGEDERVNLAFIRAVHQRERGRASVRGEEKSHIVPGARRVWVIDPVEGTGEYVDDSIPDARRTTCVAISLFVNGELVLSVVRNPFRHETFTAYSGQSWLNGRRLTCGSRPVQPGVSYDYCHWEGARFDMRPLDGVLGKPRGVYSAVYQACEVAAGRSAFCVFPGDTIHDIAPGALIVANAAGRVSDLNGEPLRWGDLTRGVLYASRVAQDQALAHIRRIL